MEEAAVAFRQAVVLVQDGAPHFQSPARLVGFRRFMVVAVVTVRMRMFMLVSVPGLMTVIVVMMVIRNADRLLSGQPASAVFAHQSISSEANSSSRPAQSFPLG
jgi:hypothetical protein